MRLLHLDHEQYRVNLTFNRLDSVNRKYTISNILFEFRSINVSFTTLSIWFRFFFLCITFGTMCFYMHYLCRFPVSDWSLEQKWTALHLVLLVLSNNPLYPVQFLTNSVFLRLLEVWLHTSLQTVLMLFWLSFFHGIRQNNRSLAKFYANKLLIIGTIWFTVIYTTSWSLRNQMENPIFKEQAQFAVSSFLQVLLSSQWD